MKQEFASTKKTLLIEPHYLGSLEYFVLLSRFEAVILEVNDHFIKQTYRNRCVILSANGVLPLIIPVRFDNRTIYRDVTIDHSQTWLKDHKRAIMSAYARAPYYDYLIEDFFEILSGKHVFLHDVNLAMMTLCLKILKLEIEINETDRYQEEVKSDFEDFRNTISAKSDFVGRKIYRASPYLQNFGKEFVPNLSVLDTIMCLGPQSSEIIGHSEDNSQEQM